MAKSSGKATSPAAWRGQTIARVATRRGIGEGALRRMCKRGEIATVELAGVKYIPPGEEDRLVTSLGLNRPVTEAAE